TCTSSATCGANTCGTLLDGTTRACLPAAQSLEAACAAEGAACGPPGAGGLCTAGRCEPPCHAGSACSAGRACTSASGDGACLAPGASLFAVAQCSAAANGTACGPKGLGGTCDTGVCTLACSNGAGCPGGDFCSASTGPGVCFFDCSTGQTCPGTQQTAGPRA